MKNAILAIVVLIISFNFMVAQKNDYIWPMGYSQLKGDSSTWTEQTLRKWGYYQLRFEDDGMRLYRDMDRLIGLYTTTTMYCTDEGRLHYMTNGQYLEDSTHTLIQKIGFNNPDYWDNFLGVGFKNPQGALMLPWPGMDSTIVFSSILRIDTFFSYLTSYTVIDNKLNKAVLIDAPLEIGEYKSGEITATRHGNGRDWWLIRPLYDGKGYEVYLFDKEGVKVHHQQSFGTPHFGNTWGGAAFSPDGKHYGTIDMKVWDSTTVVRLFDFDRCDGRLSNFRTDTIDNYQGSLGAGITFSPNSKFMYACNRFNVYQYLSNTDSMNYATTKKIIAEYDGFINHPTWAVATTFGPFANGPDGRLYNFTSQGSCLWLHAINYPDEEGTNSEVRQHSIAVHNQQRSAPNFPNYRLGPLDNSSCDTLGLNNHPIAKYRYEPDSIDYKRIRFTDLSYFRPETWNWDFGDGSPKISIKSPYHSFPKDGTYKVCLTVSNENSSNTSCRDITIGVSSTDDESEHPIDVNIFPNPVQDILLVTIGEYVPAQAYIEFYSALGQQVHRQRVFYGHNNVDMTTLPAGVFAWRIVDRGVLVKSGEVVKM